MTARAAILSVGDELTTGLTVDTNTAWLARELFTRGAEVRQCATVGDDREAIAAAIARLTAAHDVLIITGGLGPTRVSGRSEARFDP